MRHVGAGSSRFDQGVEIPAHPLYSLCVDLAAIIPSLFICLFAATPRVGEAGVRLEKVVDLPLPGPVGRFDYETVDVTTGRLYISAMGAGQVLVYDVRERRLVSVLDGFPSATGITLAKSSGLVFVSVPGRLLDRTAGRGGVKAVRLSDLVTVATFSAGGFPDGSAWVPDQGEIFVSNERGGEETVIGGKPMRELATLSLGGEAGNTAYDPTGHRVLVNVQNRREVVEIDPVKISITRRVALPGTCAHNHGLLVDDVHRLAFVACDGNAHLLTLGLPDLRTLEVDTVGDDPDVLALDSLRHLLYVASESGVVAVFSVDAGGPKPLWRGNVGPDAHSVAVDPRTGFAYIPLSNPGGHPVLRVMRLAGLPTSGVRDRDSVRK